MPKDYHKSNKNHKKFTTRKTMKKQNNTKKPIIVGLIYAEWCVHCRAMKNDWKNLKTILKGKVAKIIEIESADQDKVERINKLNSKYDDGERLQGDSFPVIFKIKNNKIQTYNGSRDSESMKSWVFDNSEPIKKEQAVYPKLYNDNDNNIELMVKKFMDNIRGGYQYNTPRGSKNSKGSKSSKSSRGSKY
jgi:thiol-disulfide isomerase/thioredoxin